MKHAEYVSDERKRSVSYQIGALYGIANAIRERVIDAHIMRVSIDDITMKSISELFRGQKVCYAYRRIAANDYSIGICAPHASARWN